MFKIFFFLLTDSCIRVWNVNQVKKLIITDVLEIMTNHVYCYCGIGYRGYNTLPYHEQWARLNKYIKPSTPFIREWNAT